MLHRIIQTFEVGALAVDGWAVTVHLVQWGGVWAGCGFAQSPPRCTKCYSPPINGQCTNHCKGKGKGLYTCYSATYISQTRDQQRFTISEVAANWHEPMVPQRIMWPSIARANGILHVVLILTISPQSTCHYAPVCENLSKSDHAQQKKMTLCRFSRWWISAILDLRGAIMGSLKSPCTTSYR